MKRRRPTARRARNIPRNIPSTPPRPPDLQAIRRRQQLAEVDLDNQELLRRRTEADALQALAAAEAERLAALPPPQAPRLGRPVVTHYRPARRAP